MPETTKQDMLDLLESLPDDVSVDDVMYALYIRSSIDKGLDDSKAGRTVSNEEVMRELAKWRQSAGR